MQLPLIRTTVLSTAGFISGYLTFGHPWEAGAWGKAVSSPRRPLEEQREDSVKGIHTHEYFQQLANKYAAKYHSSKVPVALRETDATQGILYGKDKLGTDTVMFHDANQKSLVAFFHLGPNLADEKKNVHKGILSLILDESLCFCGFPTLPNGRGVTGRLSIDFVNAVPLDSSIILRAQVVENKGRRCVIEGSIESLPDPRDSAQAPTVFANARCILIEPRWFKYVSRLSSLF